MREAFPATPVSHLPLATAADPGTACRHHPVPARRTRGQAGIRRPPAPYTPLPPAPALLGPTRPGSASYLETAVPNEEFHLRRPGPASAGTLPKQVPTGWAPHPGGRPHNRPGGTTLPTGPPPRLAGHPLPEPTPAPTPPAHPLTPPPTGSPTPPLTPVAHSSGTMSGAPSRAASAVRSSGWRWDSRSASTRFS